MSHLTRRLMTAATSLLVGLLPLSVASPAGAFEADPPSVDFGTVAVGSTHQVSIRITPTAGTTFGGWSVFNNGPGSILPGDFTCPDGLAATCTVALNYTSSVPGTTTAQIQFDECIGGLCVPSTPATIATGTAIDAPLVTDVSASSANGTYTIGDTLTVTVAFDRDVTVNTSAGIPTLLLETGTTDRVAAYTSGSGTDTLTFSYTVGAGDTSADLDYTSPAALTLSGGTFNGVTYTVALPDPGTTGSLSANRALVIDTAAPTAGPLTLSDTHLTPAETAQVGIVFSEPVTGFTLADLTADAGTLSNLTTTDNTTWTATLTPPPGASSTGNRVTLNRSGIADAAGNAGAGTATSPEYTVATVVAPSDTTAPVSRATGPATVSATTWTVAYTATDTGTGVATVDLYAKAPGTTGYAKVATDSTDRDGQFAYTATAGDGAYSFYTVATDAAGNTEAAPTTPDVTTTLATSAPDTTAPVLSPRMGPEPVRFDLSETKTLPLRVRVNERASLRVKIRSGGELVRAWAWRHGVRGLVEQLWNGRADGTRVPPGAYRVVFVAVDPAGNRATAAARIRVTR